MKVYVSDLVPNAEVVSYFTIVDPPTIRKSKKDKEYACLELVDRTGKVDARLWDIPAGLDVATLRRKVVKVRGMVSEWEGKLQVSVSNIREAVPEDGFDMGDFFERSARDPEEMFVALADLLCVHVEDEHIGNLLSRLLNENEENFKRAPAAKSIHHAYLGGLLEHVLSMCVAAVPIAEHYHLSKDLLLAGCVLHDIGKIFELTYDMGLGYSTEGTLLGHILQGMLLIGKSIDSIEGFPQRLRMSVLHLVASHHGTLAWGSPRIPLMKESIALHLVDMLDSRLAICDKAIANGLDEEGMTEWSKALEGPLYVYGQQDN